MIKVFVSLHEVNDKDAGEKMLEVIGCFNGNCVLVLPDGTPDGIRMRLAGSELIAALTAVSHCA